METRQAIVGDYRISVIRDSVFTPHFETACTFWCWNHALKLGDQEGKPKQPCVTRQAVYQSLGGNNVVHIIRPLYLKEGGFLELSLTPYGASWEEGLVGWVFLTRGVAASKGLASNLGKSSNFLEEEIVHYNAWLRCESYSFEVYQKGADGYWDERCPVLKRSGLFMPKHTVFTKANRMLAEM